MVRDYAGKVADTKSQLFAPDYASITYVIENVPGAPLINAVRLCGTMFGLRIYRHRYFESSFPIAVPAHSTHNGETKSHRGYSKDTPYITVGGHNYNVPQGKAAMGIDWMSRDELNEAVPPAYSEYIARQYSLTCAADLSLDTSCLPLYDTGPSSAQ